MTIVITARCVSCKATRTVQEAESLRLGAERSVPICERCGSPMVAESVDADGLELYGPAA